MKRKDLNYFDNKMVEIQDHFADFSILKEKVKPRFETSKIIIIYIILGVMWILLSDKFLGLFIKDLDLFLEIQLYKGWFYVGITGIIFYFIINNKMMLFKRAIDKVFEGFEELSAAYEELMAMDEELSQQYNELEAHRNALAVSNQRYELVIEGANDGIWDWDLKNGTYLFSIKWKRTLGYNDKELADTFEAWKQLLHPEDRDRSVGAIETYMISNDGIYQNTYRLRSKDGQYRWILSRGKGVWDSDGKAIRIAGSHTDLTEQINLQEFLRQEKELSETIIYDSPMVISLLDTKGNILKYNPFAEEITGYREEELIGKNAIELFVMDSRREFVNELFKKIINGEKLRNYEFEIQCKDGQLVTVLWNIDLLHDQEGNIQGVVFIGMDITERRQMEDRLHSLAYYDLLTQLPNRTMLEEVVEKLIYQVEEKNQKLAFIYLDIDNFKNINDTMGHGSGDQLLIDVAQILTQTIKSPHVVARLGGDEFAIVMVDIKSTKDLILEIKRILKDLRRPWIIKDHEFYISVSMGMAIYPEHGTDLETLMQNADTAMFHVKKMSKDAFAVYTPNMREKTWQYIQMSSHLKDAINNEKFLLHYQPQIDLNSGKIIGVEALIRWIHLEKGFIPPTDFITFAEETGDIGKIGKWVFKTVAKQKREWEERGYTDFKISVNLSGKMLTQTDLIPNIKKMLAEYNMKSCDIELEITETAVMIDLEKAIEVLNQLKQLGVTLALDDFGTGYSSLTYLQKLPIDILKIDKELIKNIANDGKESFIFQAIVKLAHNLGLKVVAEGVETREQLMFLIKNGCDIGQGYYFSRPIPAKELEILLKTFN